MMTSGIFEYLPERGIMINTEDHQRNVSFRTDTFIGDFDGELTINECFIDVQVTLECINCPLKNRFKSICQFKIILAESEQM